MDALRLVWALETQGGEKDAEKDDDAMQYVSIKYIFIRTHTKRAEWLSMEGGEDDETRTRGQTGRRNECVRATAGIRADRR